MRSRIPCLAGALVVSFALAGCGGGEPGSAPQEQAAPQAAAAGGEDLAAMMANADLNRGKTLFLQCRACHSLSAANEPGKIGPTLYGVIGRAAGTVPGFEYSDAVTQSGLTWTAEDISAWLERPGDFLPGNKMVFIGIKNAQDRANVLAYIQQESAKPSQ